MNSYLVHLWGILPLPRRARTAIMFLLNPKFTVGVIGLVRDADGNILLVRHTYRPSAPWGLPGGGLKPGETLEECVLREIREETGIHAEVERLLSAAAHYDRRLVDMIFACHPLPGQSLSNFKPSAEISQARYFPSDALPEKMSSSLRRLVAVALKQAAGDKTARYEPEPSQVP